MKMCLNGCVIKDNYSGCVWVGVWCVCIGFEKNEPDKKKGFIIVPRGKNHSSLCSLEDEGN